MKKYFGLLLTILMLIGCNVDDGNQVTFEVLPIESIELPSSFTLNETYQIPITFYRPTNCHAYNGIISNPNENERSIAVSSYIVNNSGCIDYAGDEGLTENSFNFLVKYDYTYVFKIWKGIDDQGEDVFEIIEVPVVN